MASSVSSDGVSDSLEAELAAYVVGHTIWASYKVTVESWMQEKPRSAKELAERFSDDDYQVNHTVLAHGLRLFKKNITDLTEWKIDLRYSRDALPIDEFGMFKKRDGAPYTQRMSEATSYDNVCIKLGLEERDIADVSHEKFICTTACYLLEKQSLLLRLDKERHTALVERLMGYGERHELERIASKIRSELENLVQHLRSVDRQDRNWHDLIWDSCVSDAEHCPTLFNVLFYGTLTSNQSKRLKVGTDDEVKPIDDLIEKGKIFTSSMIQSKIKRDPYNFRLGRGIRNREIFCDQLVQMMVNSRFSMDRQKDKEHDLIIMNTINSILKDGSLTFKAFNTLCTMGICNCGSFVGDVYTEDLQKHYTQSLDELFEKLTEEKPDAVDVVGASKRVNIAAVFIDNYAKVLFSKEQAPVWHEAEDGDAIVTGTKKFTDTKDSLSLLVRCFPKREDFLMNEDRNEACVNLDQEGLLEDTLECIQSENGTLDLGDALNEICPIPWEDRNTSLNEYTPVASLPVKSSSHVQVAQVLQMFTKHFLETQGKEELILPVDPEFVLEAIPYSLLLRDMMKHVAVPIPPFHIQKHLMESLNRQIIFLRFIYIPLCNAIEFKPSAFMDMSDKIDNLACSLIDGDSSLVAPEIDPDLDTSEIMDLTEDELLNSRNDVDCDDDVDPEIVEEHESKSAYEIKLEQMASKQASSLFNSKSKGSVRITDIAKELISAGSRVMEFNETYQKASKAERKDIKLPKKDVDFVGAMKEILKSSVTNHTRLKYNLELLHAAVEHALEDESSESPMWRNNEFQKMLKSLLTDPLQLVVGPFNSLMGDGDVRPLYTHFPKMIRLISAGGKSKIVKACIFLLAQMKHLQANRPDLLKQIASIAPMLNEVIIEFANSAISRRLGGTSAISFQAIRNASVASGKARSLFSDIDKAFSKGVTFPIDSSGTKRGPPDSLMSRQIKQLKSTEGSVPGGVEVVEGKKEPVTLRKSELDHQVARFKKGGKLYPLVERISKWLKSLMLNYGLCEVDGIAANTMKNYRPLGKEQDSVIRRTYDLLRSYMKSVVNKERNKPTNNDGAPLEKEQVMDELQFFINNQTKHTCEQLVRALRSGVYEDMKFDDPNEKVCSSRKANAPKIVDVLKVLARNQNDDYAILRLKSRCCETTGRGLFKDIKLKNVDYTEKNRIEKVKVPEPTLKHAIACVPDKHETINIMRTMVLDTSLTFPFRCSEIEVVAEEDA